MKNFMLLLLLLNLSLFVCSGPFKSDRQCYNYFIGKHSSAKHHPVMTEGGNCYLLVRKKMTWNEARAKCKRYGADLASISDRVDQELIEKGLRDNMQVHKRYFKGWKSECANKLRTCLANNNSYRRGESYHYTQCIRCDHGGDCGGVSKSSCRRENYSKRWRDAKRRYEQRKRDCNAHGKREACKKYGYKYTYYNTDAWVGLKKTGKYSPAKWSDGSEFSFEQGVNWWGHGPKNKFCTLIATHYYHRHRAHARRLHWKRQPCNRKAYALCKLDNSGSPYLFGGSNLNGASCLANTPECDAKYRCCAGVSFIRSLVVPPGWSLTFYDKPTFDVMVYKDPNDKKQGGEKKRVKSYIKEVINGPFSDKYRFQSGYKMNYRNNMALNREFFKKLFDGDLYDVTLHKSYMKKHSVYFIEKLNEHRKYLKEVIRRRRNSCGGGIFGWFCRLAVKHSPNQARRDLNSHSYWSRKLILHSKDPYKVQSFTSRRIRLEDYPVFFNGYHFKNFAFYATENCADVDVCHDARLREMAGNNRYKIHKYRKNDFRLESLIVPLGWTIQIFNRRKYEGDGVTVIGPARIGSVYYDLSHKIAFRPKSYLLKKAGGARMTITKILGMEQIEATFDDIEKHEVKNPTAASQTMQLARSYEVSTENNWLRETSFSTSKEWSVGAEIKFSYGVMEASASFGYSHTTTKSTSHQKGGSETKTTTLSYSYDCVAPAYTDVKCIVRQEKVRYRVSYEAIVEVNYGGKLKKTKVRGVLYTKQKRKVTFKVTETPQRCRQGEVRNNKCYFFPKVKGWVNFRQAKKLCYRYGYDVATVDYTSTQKLLDKHCRNKPYFLNGHVGKDGKPVWGVAYEKSKYGRFSSKINKSRFGDKKWVLYVPAENRFSDRDQLREWRLKLRWRKVECVACQSEVLDMYTAYVKRV